MQRTEAFKDIQDRIVEARWYWRTWKTLYIGSEKKFELLNRSARSFFGIVEQVLINHVILGLTKLNDSAKGTVTFKKLLNEQRLLLPQSALDAAEAVRVEFETCIEPLEVWRNKYLAHVDPQYVKGGPKPLPELKLPEIDRAIELAEKFMNTIGDDMEYSWGIVGELGSAQVLLHQLLYADRYCKQNKDAGYRPFDLEADLAALEWQEDKAR